MLIPVLAAPIFLGYIQIMMRLPSTHGNVPACFVGAAYTPDNVFFSAALSLMTAWMLWGLWDLARARTAKKSWQEGSLGLLGFVIGFFTVFCALCTIPVISIFGLAVGLGFFTTYNAIFKGLSLGMMAYALWLMEQRRKNCGCTTARPRKGD
jgi:hypothetical protein